MVKDIGKQSKKHVSRSNPIFKQDFKCNITAYNYPALQPYEHHEPKGGQAYYHKTTAKLQILYKLYRILCKYPHYSFFLHMKKTCLSQGRRIAYYQNGVSAGLPLLLLHGFCEDASVWDGFIKGIEGIALIRIDLPGFGGSDLPGAAGMEHYADAVKAVLDELNVPSCVLIGHSLGGYAGLAFAKAYPNYLAGLGLFHSHPFADKPEQTEARQRGIEMLHLGKKDLYVAQLFPKLFPPAFAEKHPDILDALIRRGRQHSAAGIIGALESMIARPDQMNTLREAAYPVLFLLGEEDTLVPPAQGLSAATAPGIVDVHLLPGVGHMGMFEATAETAGICTDFWRFCATHQQA